MGTPVIDPRRVDEALEESISAAVSSSPGLPGVVAGVTTDQSTISLRAAGVRATDGTDPMTTDSVFAIFSTTKPITAVLALQLVDEGRLDLDTPAAEYAPRLGTIEVLEGFDDRGELLLRAPKTPITTRQLLTNTAGFAYDFFDPTYRRLGRDHGVPGVITASLRSLTTPLLFDPGTRWSYGSSIDWVGLVVEGITGRRLGEVMSERILTPLGMADTSFALPPEPASRRAVLHHRTNDGSLTPNHRWSMPADPEVQMGGQGLHSTVPDYLAFIRMWLNDGRSDTGEQILSPQTVAEASRSHLGRLAVTPLLSASPAVTNDAEFFPGAPKSWGLLSMINDEDAPTGRPAGSLSWAGLANLYFWIDRRNRIGGYWASQVFPFFDRAALEAYLDFETAVYRTITS